MSNTNNNATPLLSSPPNLPAPAAAPAPAVATAPAAAPAPAVATAPAAAPAPAPALAPALASVATLCTPSLGQEDDWKDLYEAAFPQDERMAVSEVRTMLTAGNILLHKTCDSSGALQCFSLVTPLSNFLLLAYIATDQVKRSSGAGTKHMNELISILKKQYPTHLGLFLEIESTLEANLSTAEDLVRKRRLAFYQRLKCQRLTGRDYLLPSYTPGAAARQGELLWFEFGASASGFSDATMQSVIAEIYTRGYNITTADPSYIKVVGQFDPVTTGGVNQQSKP